MVTGAKTWRNVENSILVQSNDWVISDLSWIFSTLKHFQFPSQNFPCFDPFMPPSSAKLSGTRFACRSRQTASWRHTDVDLRCHAVSWSDRQTVRRLSRQTDWRGRLSVNEAWQLPCRLMRQWKGGSGQSQSVWCKGGACVWSPPLILPLFAFGKPCCVRRSLCALRGGSQTLTVTHNDREKQSTCICLPAPTAGTLTT